MADEKVPVTNGFGGTKFIAVMFSLIILGGMFGFTWYSNLLNTSIIKYFCIALISIVLTGVGGNVLEKCIPVLTILAPLIPDMISKSILGNKSNNSQIKVIDSKSSNTADIK